MSDAADSSEGVSAPSQTVTVSLLSGRSVQVTATDSTVLHQIREEAGAKLGVRIAKLRRADGSALEEQQSLAEAGIDLHEPLHAVGCSIAVGSRVTLKAGVEKPEYGWGSMTRGESGIVTSINRTNVTINFPSQSGWSGKLDEMELAETISPEGVESQEPQVTVTVSLLGGRSVQVTATDSTVLHQIRKEAGAKLGVHIAKLLRADGSALEEQQSLAEAGIDLQEPLQALVGSGTIEIGSWVKVREDVQNPRYGWGGIDRRNHCGRVRAIEGDSVTVDFDNHSGWSGHLDEMELAETISPEGVESQEPQVTVTVSLLSGRSVQVTATDSTVLHQIRREAGAKLGVHIAKLLRADGSALEEQQSLAEAGIDLQEPLQALVGSGTIEIGSWVKVREDVQNPRYGWGSIDRRNHCGRVCAIGGDSVTVDFDNHSGWSGHLDEMELF